MRKIGRLRPRKGFAPMASRGDYEVKAHQQEGLPQTHPRELRYSRLGWHLEDQSADKVKSQSRHHR